MSTANTENNTCVSKKRVRDDLSRSPSDSEEEDEPTRKRINAVRPSSLSQQKPWVLMLPSINRRILCTIMVAYYLALFREGLDLASWRILSHLNSNNPSFQHEAFEFAERHVKPFAQLVPQKFLNEESTLEKTLPFLQNHHISFCDYSGTFEFICQCHVFHVNSGTLLASYPEKFDPTQRQLYFSAERDETGEIVNIGIIQNLLAFFRCFGVFCFFCKKFFRGHGTQHKCRKTSTCFACRRPMLTPLTYVTPQTKAFFCHSGISPNTAKECEKCNMRIISSDCAKYHKQKVCRWGFVCQKCNCYIYFNKFTSKENMVKEHVCGLYQCYYCGLSEQKTDHVCKLHIPPIDQAFTNLGFLNFEFAGHSLSNCETCFLSNKPCSFCADNQEREVVQCDVLVECKTRESFESFAFSKFNAPNAPKEVVCESYLPDALKKKTLAKRSTTKFGKSIKKVLENGSFKENTNNVVEKFLSFVLSQNIVNTTFVLIDENRNCFEEIIKCLYKNGVKPVVIGSPRIFMVDVPLLDIRFINLENYLDVSFTDLQEHYLKDANIFFPLRWIKKSFFEYDGDPPKLQDFWEFEDSDSICQKKQSYVFTLSASLRWNFKENLTRYSQKKCFVMAKATLQFVKDSFECQSKLQKCMPNISHFLHPLSKPLFTKASYAYRLMCLYSKNMEKVRVVNSAVGMQSSKGELEFAFYTKWLHPSLEIQTAWSPKGQKRFPETYPDFYIPSEKKCGFWNGCLVHGHPDAHCSFKKDSRSTKNMFKVDFKTAFETYESKKQKLLKNHPEEVQEIQEMWHCEWLKQKATNRQVKYFMNHVYRNPPLYRLEPRAAGKSEKNIEYIKMYKLCF